MGSRSRGSVSRAAWKILIPRRMRCRRGSSKADRSVVPKLTQYDRSPVRQSLIVAVLVRPAFPKLAIQRHKLSAEGGKAGTPFRARLVT